MRPTPMPVRIAVLTVSDSRTEETDTSGRLLVTRLQDAGHLLHAKRIVPDDIETITTTVRGWQDDPTCDVILSTGGTGITGRDVTVDVFERMYTKAIVGFGELFRALSYEDIGPSTIQSRASGGLAKTTLMFALPGSTGACTLGWDKILRHQLDSTTRPCNLVALMPRFAE
ncbi:MAG: molybdenum cofactor biosynthesis protein B [Myxococcota bacterium]|jgi:molybdenum cofactor biosynthesis protein B